MTFSRKVIGSALTAAMLVTSVTPAMAQGWYGGGGLGWGGGGWGHERHHDDTGSVLAGVLIGAVVVGVLASASKNKRARDAGQNGSQNGRDYPQNSQNYPDDRRDDRARGNINSENAAVDACALAAENRAGSAGSVRDISTVSRSSDGWDVQGVVENRDGWRDRTPERHKFTCSVRYGMVDSVYVEDAKVAYGQ